MPSLSGSYAWCNQFDNILLQKVLFIDSNPWNRSGGTLHLNTPLPPKCLKKYVGKYLQRIDKNILLHFRIVNLWLMLSRILSHHPKLDAAKQVSKNLFVDKHKESCASSKSLSVNLLKGVTKWVAPGQMQAH